ncbi:MAG TPA: exodeoxyribonuclease VII small subunit [Bacteroidales bacterium]|nr:exodeoxyribonuclease VII small subunit [Bacteroidales bacterium]
MKSKPTYKEAIEELESIVGNLESDEISVDELSSKLARASALIEICQKALHATEGEVKKFLEELNRGKSAETQ